MLGTFVPLMIYVASATKTSMSEVPAPDFAKISPGDFRDDELDVPFYLAHFHRVANSIEDSGPGRGFITLPVWRPEAHNRLYNARVLENYLALAYFYCTDRDWNPYYGHPAVRERLEALPDLWCRVQNTNGWFSEYGPERWNLPATGFAVMFMGGTLSLLHDGPPIDSDIYGRVVNAQRKAIVALLTDRILFDSAKVCSNQYSGLWGGTQAYLEFHPDAELDKLMRERLAQSLEAHISPAGYWYEARGCDWAYTLRTHHGNQFMAWHYARGTDLGEFFIKGEERWAEWTAYNAVLEPDSSEFVLNRAIETRTRGKYESRHNSLAEKVVMARAFLSTQSEARDALARKRRQLEENWPNVPELQVGNDHAYSPHILLNLNHYRWYPTEEQREEAMKLLPYLASKRFNHQRTDSYAPQVYTFIRRPAYYAIFNTGRSLSKQQRFGLGLLWTDEDGTILQSQTGSHDAAWGTRAAGAEDVYETGIVGADFQVAGSPVSPEAGSRDLEQGELEVSYPLQNSGQKTVTFTDDCIVVAVQHTGDFAEQLPMLLPEGTGIELEGGIARLSGEKCLLELSFGKSVKPEVMETTTTVANKRLSVLNLHAENTLTYRISKPGNIPAAK